MTQSIEELFATIGAATETDKDEDKDNDGGTSVIADVRYVRQGSSLFQTDSQALVVLDKIPAGTYTMMHHPERGFFLAPAESLKVPSKLYGSTQAHADRFLAAFAQRGENTGILLSGEKGSGKSLLGCVMSAELLKADIPTILITQPYTGDAFNNFIASINQPCMIYFDEFEKIYIADKGQQEGLLTLIAGVYSGKKLFVFTSNNERAIDKHMLNRPGRIFYHVRYRGVDAATITQYADEHLINKKHLKGLEIIATQVDAFNFDMLKSLIEEMNRFGEPAKDAIKLMNIRPESSNWITYDGVLFRKGVKVPDSYVQAPNPLIMGVHGRYKTGKKDNDGDDQWDSFNMSADKMTKFDYAAGTMTFEDGKLTVELVRRVTSGFEF